MSQELIPGKLYVTKHDTEFDWVNDGYNNLIWVTGVQTLFKQNILLFVKMETSAPKKCTDPFYDGFVAGQKVAYFYAKNKTLKCFNNGITWFINDWKMAQ